MSWQEELRKLDEELAAGQISADDYRVRRDQVLSSAVSAGPEAPAGQPKPGEATQFVPRPPAPLGPPPAGPQPPMAQPPGPQSPGQQPAGDAESTQVVPAVGDADRTQAVRGWHAARPGEPDADRTQVVPGVPPQAYAGGMPPRPAPDQGAFPPPPGYGWQQDEVNAPWAGSDFPPLATAGSPDWIRQGPEVFEQRSSTGRRLLIILLAVLVLAGAGVGVYFLVKNRDGGNPPPAAQTTPSTSSTPTSTTPPRPSDPNVALLQDMPQPPASQQQDAKVLDVSQLVELKLMDKAEMDLAAAAGVKKVPFRSAVRKPPADGPTADILNAMVLPTAGEAEARKLVQDLRGYQESHGMLYIAEPLPNMPPTVLFEKQVTADRAIYRGLWVSGKNVIRITTVQIPLTDEAALSGSYRNHTEVMLRAFPPD